MLYFQHEHDSLEKAQNYVTTPGHKLSSSFHKQLPAPQGHHKPTVPAPTPQKRADTSPQLTLAPGSFFTTPRSINRLAQTQTCIQVGITPN